MMVWWCHYYHNGRINCFSLSRIFFLKRLVAWFFERKINRNSVKLKTLRGEKKKILEKVMDKETYKVALEILNRFAENVPRPPSQQDPYPSGKNSFSKCSAFYFRLINICWQCYSSTHPTNRVNATFSTERSTVDPVKTYRESASISNTKSSIKYVTIHDRRCSHTIASRI